MIRIVRSPVGRGVAECSVRKSSRPSTRERAQVRWSGSPKPEAIQHAERGAAASTVQQRRGGEACRLTVSGAAGGCGSSNGRRALARRRGRRSSRVRLERCCFRSPGPRALNNGVIAGYRRFAHAAAGGPFSAGLCLRCSARRRSPVARFGPGGGASSVFGAFSALRCFTGCAHRTPGGTLWPLPIAACGPPALPLAWLSITSLRTVSAPEHDAQMRIRRSNTPFGRRRSSRPSGSGSGSRARNRPSSHTFARLMLPSGAVLARGSSCHPARLRATPGCARWLPAHCSRLPRPPSRPKAEI